jgi:hypothetical protein
MSLGSGILGKLGGTAIGAGLTAATGGAAAPALMGDAATTFAAVPELAGAAAGGAGGSMPGIFSAFPAASPTTTSIGTALNSSVAGYGGQAGSMAEQMLAGNKPPPLSPAPAGGAKAPQVPYPTVSGQNTLASLPPELRDAFSKAYGMM